MLSIMLIQIPGFVSQVRERQASAHRRLAGELASCLGPGLQSGLGLLDSEWQPEL